MSKGIRFHYEFSTGDLLTTPNDGEITVEHGNGDTSWHAIHGIMAVKNSCLTTSGTMQELSILTRTETETCVYRITTDKLVICQYRGYDNHWEAGYDRFVRDGGWPGTMDPHPEATTTIVHRVMS